jgi:hypothetical protein
MCVCSLWDAHRDCAAEEPVLAGTLVSSLHRLKDTDNTGKGARCRLQKTHLTCVRRCRLLCLPRPVRQTGGRVPSQICPLGSP